MTKFANHFKTIFQHTVARVGISEVSLTFLPEQNLPAEKCCTNEWNCFSIEKHVIKETVPKVGCFAGFYDHHLMNMSAHMHAYHYPLFETGTKTDLRMIDLCRKDRVLLSKHK